MLLLFVAAGMFSTGVGKLEALGMLPQSPILWDTSALVSDAGLLGSFLGGLVGCRARPLGLEVVAYAGYLVVAGALVFRMPRRAAKARSSENAVPAGAARAMNEEA